VALILGCSQKCSQSSAYSGLEESCTENARVIGKTLISKISRSNTVAYTQFGSKTLTLITFGHLSASSGNNTNTPNIARNCAVNPLRIHRKSLQHVSHHCNALTIIADLFLQVLNFILDIR
jgi:hypothetical protein